MDNELLDDLWNDNSLLNDSIFSTFVHRLIHQYSLQIHQIPSGQLYATFNTLLNTLRQSPTRANHNNLFNWIYHTFHNLNEYQSFEDYLMNQDDSEGIGVNIPRNPEGESDVEDEDYHGGRNPYFLLQKPGHEGKFTAQFKARKPHLRHLKSLEEFAHYILAHPSEFNKISKQRANYYRNLIQRGSGNQNKGMTKPETEEERRLRQQQDIDEESERFQQELINENIRLYANKSAKKRETERKRQERALQERKKEESYINLLRLREYGKKGVGEKISRSLNRVPPHTKKKEAEKAFEKINIFTNSEDSPAVIEFNKRMQEVKDSENFLNRQSPQYRLFIDKLRIADEAQEEDVGRGRLTKKMMKDLRAYHKQVGGKISAKDFELMLKETYKSPDKRDKHIGDYYIDESLSTPENVVYHNSKTGETKVAYRGTEGTLKDWGNNALYAFGMHNTSKRYKRSNEIQKQVEQKYGTANLDVLGHSQSGAYAQEIGKNAKNVIVLNPATHPGYSPKTSNATVVRSKGDAVSGLKYLNPLNWGKKKTADVEIKAETYNPVTEHLPGVLERLPEDTILGNGRKRKRNKKLRRLCDCCGAKCPYCR